MSITQHSFIPDNELHEPQIKKPSVPVVKLIGGRWCWLVAGSDEYRHEPELEQILLAAQSRQQRRAA